MGSGSMNAGQATYTPPNSVLRIVSQSRSTGPHSGLSLFFFCPYFSDCLILLYSFALCSLGISSLLHILGDQEIEPNVTL